MTLVGSQSTDEDGQIVSFLWEQISGTSVVLNSADQITTTFTAPNIEDNLFFSLSVTDDGFSTTKDTVIINIINTNANPVANAGQDQVVYYNQVVTLDGSQRQMRWANNFIFMGQISGTSVVLNSADQVTTTLAPAEDNILVFISGF